MCTEQRFLNTSQAWYLSTMVHRCIRTAIFIGAQLALISFQASCGIIVMCPVNADAQEKLNMEFSNNILKCSHGDDKVCEKVVNDAVDLQKMCKNCRRCKGDEKYEEEATDAKNMNRCQYHKDGEACFAVATREGLKSKEKHRYSYDEVAYYKLACEYGNTLACELAKSRGDEMAAGIEKNVAAKECTDGCNSVYPSCLVGCNNTIQCRNECMQQLKMCHSSCR